MTSLPIVQRELLVSSRKRLTFWSRIVAALGGFLAVFFILGVEPDFMRAGALGVKLFQWLTWPAFVACLFGSALLTADCLSVEKREGTLGLLFLTDLKGYDVVLGKFVAKSLHGVFCLLAILPMLALPILLGGVTAGNFWRIVLVLLNTMFVSLSIGIWTSVRCRDPRNVFAVAEFLVFLLVLAPILATAVLPTQWRFIPGHLSPVFAFGSAMPGPGARAISSQFYPSVFTQHLFGWLCLVLASWRVQASWQEKPKSMPTPRRWRQMLRGNAATRLALRRQLLPINPMLWMESRDRIVRVVLTLVLFIIAVFCWFLNNKPAGFHWSDLRYAIITVALLHFTLTLLVAFDAGSRLVAARQDGALAVVLATQLSVEEILRGEFLALKRLFGWPLGVVFAFDTVWLISVISHGNTVNHIAGAVITGLCLPAVLIAHCYGLTWTALYNGLRAKRPHGAALQAFVVIIGMPLAMFGILMLSSALHDSFIAGILAFTGLNIANAWIFGNGAYHRLRNDFRQSLTEHEPATPNDFAEDYALLR